MNGIMNEKVIVEKYESDQPLIQKIDSLIDNCIRDCHEKNFHTFGHICVYDIKLTNIGNNEIIILTISDKNMSLYQLNKKRKIARKIGFLYNQLKSFKIKI